MQARSSRVRMLLQGVYVQTVKCITMRSWILFVVLENECLIDPLDICMLVYRTWAMQAISWKAALSRVHKWVTSQDHDKVQSKAIRRLFVVPTHLCVMLSIYCSNSHVNDQGSNYNVIRTNHSQNFRRICDQLKQISRQQPCITVRR
jgi:hypothetical protein